MGGEKKKKKERKKETTTTKQEDKMLRRLTLKCKIDKVYVSYVSQIHISHKKHTEPDLVNVRKNHTTFKLWWIII